MASSLRQAAPGPTKLLFHLIPRDREATLIVNCNPAHQVPFETGFVLGCFLDRPSSVQGRLLSFGRNAKHDIVLPAGPSGAKLSSPSNQSRVTKSTRSYQNYRNDHFFFYLAPSGELILRDLSPRLTALEIKDLNHREASLHALRGDPRQRVIPSNKTGIIITFGTSTSFELRWATSSNANQRDLAAHALAMHVSGMTITAPEQDTSQLKPPLHHSRHLRSQYTPSGGSSSAPERPLHKYTKLGAGGFGEVWKSVDLSSGELWAVKEIKSELSDDKWKHLFLKEVETLKQLKHENIVSFEGWQDFCFGGTSLLIFQLYDGNLNHLIFYDSRSRQQGRDQETGLQPTPGSAPTWYTQLVKQMLAALQYLHSSGIVHRDIKPDNIMYNKNQSRPDFFLGDFGLSMTQEALTRSGATTAGTVFYLAPELVNPSAASRFSDVWALGLTFARVLGFVKPQEGDLDAQYWAAKLRRHGFVGEYVEPSHPKERTGCRISTLARYALMPPLVARMLDPDPQQRPHDFARLLHPTQVVGFWGFPSRSLHMMASARGQQQPIPVRRPRQPARSEPAVQPRQAEQRPPTRTQPPRQANQRQNPPARTQQPRRRQNDSMIVNCVSQDSSHYPQADNMSSHPSQVVANGFNPQAGLQPQAQQNANSSTVVNLSEERSAGGNREQHANSSMVVNVPDESRGGGRNQRHVNSSMIVNVSDESRDDGNPPRHANSSMLVNVPDEPRGGGRRQARGNSSMMVNVSDSLDSRNYVPAQEQQQPRRAVARRPARGNPPATAVPRMARRHRDGTFHTPPPVYPRETPPPSYHTEAP